MKFADIGYGLQVRVRGGIKRALDTWSIRRLPAYLIDRIPVVDLVVDGNAMARRYQLQRAFDMIRGYYPAAHTRFVRDIRRLLIDNTISKQAMYFIGTRSCTLSPELFCSTDATLAAALVHEGTHARLDARGVIQIGARRRRVERTCMREETHFVSRFPQTPELEQWLRKRSDYADALNR